MNVLVTGAAGFIGSHFVELLLAKAKCRVVALDSFNHFYDPQIKRNNVRGFVNDPRVRLIEGSFCDPALVQRIFSSEQITHIVHLGAYAGVRPSVADPLLYEEHNVRGTLVLLEAARRYPVRRFLLTSSSTVYGHGAQAPFREGGPLGNPLSPYGATKRAAELLGQTYYQLHQVPVVCLRPFSVYGRRVRPDLALACFCQAMLAGRPLKLFGDGSVERDFTHVSDICSGFWSALTAENVIGEAINLGHHQPVSIRKLISLLERTLGLSAQIEYCPAAEGDMPLTCADLSKAERLLDYHPRMSLADGIREYVGSLVERRQLVSELSRRAA